ncbi:5'-nucleotidase-like [Apostichopus japonicus]|uniref:5'-nucleotidase-like n=1 Tax=Stichopus japonicus TaxID=307972 RepID=UPI003AB29F39
MAVVKGTQLTVILLTFISSFAPGNALFNLTILHTNDIHGLFDETDVSGLRPCTDDLRSQGECFGGIARRATVIDDVRSTTENVILLDAGDQLQGPLWFYVYRGTLTAKFMNRLSYDAMALGQHDFDIGVDKLTEFIQNLTFPILASNIDAAEEPGFEAVIASSTVLNVNGYSIAVVGFTDETNVNFSRTGDLMIGSYIDAIQIEVDRLINEENINTIVVLGHSDFPNVLSAASQVRGVDIWVVGRSPIFPFNGESPEPMFQPNTDYPVLVSPSEEPDRSVLVIQTHSYGKYLGRLNVQFDEAGEISSYDGNPILLDESVAKDAETENLLEIYRGPVEALAEESAGYTLVPLDGSFETCGREECNLGNTMADSFMDYYLSNDSYPYWGNINFAISNAGSIIASLDRGDVTFGDLSYAIPFGDYLVVVEMRGKHVLEMLEHSAAGLEPGVGGYEFLHVSGLRLEYDLSKSPGSRLVSALTLCTECEIPQFIPITDDVVYTFVTNSYISSGGDGYTVVVDNAISRTRDGPDDKDVWARYLRKTSPVWTGISGRVTFTESTSACANPTTSSIIKLICQLI